LLQELQFFGDVLDLLFRGRADTESGNYRLATEEVFAAGINDAKSGKVRDLRRMLRAEQLFEAAGTEAHFGAWRMREIFVVRRQERLIPALEKCAQESVASLGSDFSR